MVGEGFPGASNGKESTCNAGDMGSIPGLVRSPGEGHGNPLQYSGLENPMDRGAWRVIVHGVTKRWTQLSIFIRPPGSLADTWSCLKSLLVLPWLGEVCYWQTLSRETRDAATCPGVLLTILHYAGQSNNKGLPTPKHSQTQLGGDSWVPWTARRSNQSILKEISPNYSLEGLMLKLKLQSFGHMMWRTDWLEKTLRLGKTEDERRRGR